MCFATRHYPSPSNYHSMSTLLYHFSISFLLTASLPQTPAAGVQGVQESYACGGDIATPPFDVQQYIKTHMRYPEAALKADIQGTVFISFIVDSTGMLQQFTIKRGADLGYGLPEEALRIVQSMPCWKPAKMNNKPVASSFTLPVRFILE